MKEEFPNYQIGDVDFKDKTCFNDFDGELHFLNSERPYMRCLSFHALLAREHALDYGWIDENELKELDGDDMWSDGFLDEKTRKFIDEWRVDVCSQSIQIDDTSKKNRHCNQLQRSMILLDLIFHILCICDCAVNSSNCGQVDDKAMVVDFCIEKQSKTTLKQTLWTDSTKEMAVSSVINSDTLVSPVPYTMSHIWTHMDTNATINNQLSFASLNCQPTIVLMDQRTNAKSPAHQTVYWT
ncbi:hypothetical protein BATDEDRAFT_23309 [Batrachochytrium dendrobatidis JAM81]|uniref:Uncharacterized protein n=1 Tax=Batrachochytrium dendrobatidis (strain JAM81 / FGSC 10211) TaxID=684364 RepID=F4NYM5_BATDJ|nr:uncharacterized protein BATDEDRAFT_23309 [Batrachochytrium dendrobatidis JAM81]EGF82055.1 hypothetical protein BATDEDRAFT_23309 [Batrachochytrium dendrobatidis JAM81]|eukprot:XP_006677252.1 hypothetical protein BATDEDRAFT_23309 [Batrachochytrium dendrobatidis JAM81]